MIKATIDLIQNVTPLTVVSHGNIRNLGLRSFLLESQGSEPGHSESFLAEPFFESMFPWETVPTTLDEMVQRHLIQPKLRETIRTAAPNVTKLRTHQAQALEAIRNGESIVVTTGTSSGKTECFLYPILDQLASELESGGIQHGVRALFLYPLNALIESQRKRFEALCSGFGNGANGLKKIRFALYNGRTNGQPDLSLAQMKSRSEIRAVNAGAYPPHLLVTNSTMLEYALVRPQDREIFSKSKHLRYVILDEAHTYLGSDAAEMAMRLRRTLDAFGVKPGQVQFIATSATVSGDANSSEQLQKFLSQLGGIPQSKVRVIGGARCAPDLPLSSTTNTPAVALEKMQATEDPVERFQILIATAEALKLRQRFQVSPRQKLATISQMLGLNTSQTLEFLDLASTACRAPKRDFFLPLKAHLFQRTFAGIWSCSNPGCDHRQPELNDPKGPWPYGKVWVQHPETRKTRDNAVSRNWSRCECGAPIFQVVYCAHCGEPHLAAQKACDFDAPLQLTGRSELELLADEEQEESLGNDGALPAGANGQKGSVTPMLLHPRAGYWSPLYAPGDSEWIADGENSDTATEKGIRSTCPGNGELRCDRCHSLFHLPTQFDGATFPTAPHTGLRASYLPSKAVYQALVDRILLHDTSLNKDLPLGGRKLLGFTDSRQGTAYNAAAKGLLGEMDATRIWLWNALLDLGPGIDREAALRDLEAEMQAQADSEELSIETIKRIQKKHIEQRLCEIEAGSIPTLDLPQAHEYVKVGLRRAFAQAHGKARPEDVPDFTNEKIKEFFKIPILKDFEEMASLFVWRELVFRSRRKRCLESLGMLSIRYHGIDKIAQAPAGLRLEDYKSFLNMLLDFAARRRGALELPNWEQQQILRCFGESIHPNLFLDSEDIARYDNPNPPQVLRIYERLTMAWLEKNGLDGNWASVRTLFRAAKQDLETQEILTAGKIRSACIRLTLPKNLWICPNTGVLLDRILGDFSPYTVSQSDRTVKAIPAGDGFVAPNTRSDWNAIRNAAPRPEWWIDLHQRILDTAPEEAFPIVQEHSAQLEAMDLESYQKSFEDGRINILNCSTTMEMGVDIGDVSIVAMTNVPPYAHNYLQRAGRVGRGDQGQSLAWTIAGIGSHEQNIWKEPMEWVGAQHSTPHVSLESRIIVQRHVNSWLLARWLATDGARYSDSFTQLRDFFLGIPGISASSPRQSLVMLNNANGNLNAPASIHTLLYTKKAVTIAKEHQTIFAECVGAAPIQSFLDWLEIPLDEQANQQLFAMLGGTVFEHASQGQLRAQSRASFGKAIETWQHDAERLLLAMESGTSAFVSRMRYEIKALGKKQTIGYLAECAVLPLSGLPTEVVTCTLPEPSNNGNGGNARKEKGEDGKGIRGYPSRPRPIAIREFAPGSQIIRDGMVHTIEKIVMNWKPVAGGQFADPQSLRDVKTCVLCGATWVSSAGMGSQACPECHHPFDEAPQPITRTLLIPSGFLAEQGANKNYESIQRSVVERPHIGLTPDSGRTLLGDGRTEIRYGRAVITHMNGGAGANDQGEFEDRFQVCLGCGKALPWFYGTNDPLSGHNTKGSCNGAPIKTVSLGALEMTDALAIQLPFEETGAKARMATSTWAVALREQVAKQCGVRIEEIGWGIRSGSNGYSAILYDTAPGGANFCTSTKVLQAIPNLLRQAHRVMEQCDCEAVCHRCLLRRDLQYSWRDLNRQIALELLDSTQLTAMALPEEWMLLGPKTEMAIHGAVGGILRELSQAPGGTLTVPLYGDPSTWEPEDWPVLEAVRAWLRKPDSKLRFVVSQSAWNSRDKGLFESLFAIGSVVIGAYDELSSGVVLADFRVADTCVRWVACCPDQNQATALSYAGVIGKHWSNGGTGFVIQGPGPKEQGDFRSVGLADLYPSHLANVRFEADAPIHIAEFGSTILAKLQGFLPTGEITKAHYSDRYLFSPLQFRVLRELLHALNPKAILIERQFKESSGYMSRREDPFGWKSDYPMNYNDSSVQKTEELIRNLFIPPQQVRVVTCTKGKQWIPHNRLLTLEWESGEKYEITSHFGVSGWKITSGVGLKSPHDIQYSAVNWVDLSVASIINARFTMAPTETITFFVEKVSNA